MAEILCYDGMGLAKYLKGTREIRNRRIHTKRKMCHVKSPCIYWRELTNENGSRQIKSRGHPSLGDAHPSRSLQSHPALLVTPRYPKAVPHH